MAGYGDINWNPRVNMPTNGVGVGISLLDEALQQIMAKKEAEKAAQAAADAKLREQLMVETRERDRMAETNRHNLAGEGSASQNADLQERRFAREGYGAAVPLLQAGNTTLARPFLSGPPGPGPGPGPQQPGGASMVADMLGESAGIAPPPMQQPPPPDLGTPPPPWAGQGPPPLTQDAPPQDSPMMPPQQPQGPPPQGPPPQRGPMLDPLDALVQGMDAEKKTRSAGELADWQKARQPGRGAGKFDQQAYADVVAAAQGGQLGKETMEQAYSRRRHELESEDAQIRAAAIRGASYPSRELRNDAANDRNMNVLDREMKNFDQTVDWKSLVTGGRKLHASLANLASDDHKDALKHKDAAFQLGGFFRNGPPTEGEMHYLYSNLGGVVGNGLQTFIQKMATGDLTPVEMDMLRRSAKTARSEWLQNVEDAKGAAVEMFGPGSGLDFLAPNVNHKLKARFKALGEDIPDIFTTPEGSGVQLGSGRRPSTAGAPAAPAGGALKASEDAADAILRMMGRRR